jgi:hypothetical protein
MFAELKYTTALVLSAIVFLAFHVSENGFLLQSRTVNAQGSATCDKMAWQSIGKSGGPQNTVWKQLGHSPFFYKAGMTIDADGASKAYHPRNIGLDHNDNGKDKGRWIAIVLVNGRPHVQGPNDPAPGYYVSTSSLQDKTKAITDPRRYVDSETIPYIALPPKVMNIDGQCARDDKACLGDIAVVMNSRNEKLSYAIVADQGPRTRIGEGSIALAKALGINSSPRTGGMDRGILYLVFAGSGNEKPRILEEINTMGQELFNNWGGKEKLTTCLGG